MSAAILRAEHMFKEFGATKAVTDVTIELHKGTVLGLVGENGSGKSTLSSMIAGVYPPTKGAMFFNGQEFKPASVLDARKAGIQYLTQEQGTIDRMTVAENLFLGEEDSFGRFGMVNMRRLIIRAKEILEENGLSHVDPTQPIDNYSFEDRKMIETARALSKQPVVLMIDETTTALSKDGTERIYEIIEQQKKKGTAILIISHDLSEVQCLCDEVMVLRDGVFVDLLCGDEVTPENMRRKMIGREFEGSYYRADFECTFDDEIVLSVRELSLDGVFRDVNFDLHKGEILGIGGLSDCGMHEVLKTTFGAIKPSRGSVILTDGNIEINNTTTSVQRKIAYIPKDRDKESLFLPTSIRDNIVAASLDKIKKGIFISPFAERQIANEEAKKMDVKMQDISQMVRDLSGGNKQKVVLAKWLANDSRIFIMDCPTRGIDVGVKAKIYRLMEDFKRQGISILMVSEEMMELIGMADRILTMKNGQQTGEFLRSASLCEADIIQMII
ncbi:MAG TPA: sugar ABC transporter ATP-binding protein [Clostridiaceae bacterium]|nr:sugar ABC transporter ATP-binding protein [Clostridiaceae bacterium]